MVQRSFFEWVLDAFEGFAADVPGEMSSTSHRRGLKVWFDDAHKEHYEAQLIRLGNGDIGLEIGFHAEYPQADDNDDVLRRVLRSERTWRRTLGDSAEVGEFLGNDRWRRISEVWEAPDPDDPEATMEIAARLADYALAIEAARR